MGKTWYYFNFHIVFFWAFTILNTQYTLWVYTLHKTFIPKFIFLKTLIFLKSGDSRFVQSSQNILHICYPYRRLLSFHCPRISFSLSFRISWNLYHDHYLSTNHLIMWNGPFTLLYLHFWKRTNNKKFPTSQEGAPQSRKRLIHLLSLNLLEMLLREWSECHH